MATITYAPTEFILDDFPHGDTLALSFEVLDEDTGDPIDLTLGHVAAMRFELRDGTELITATSGGGEIVLGVGSIDVTVETSGWPQNCTAYADLQITTPSGNIETWIAVKVKTKKSITTPV